MKNNRVEIAYEKPSIGQRMTLWKIVAAFIVFAGIFVGQQVYLIQNASLIQDAGDNSLFHEVLLIVSFVVLLPGFGYLGKHFPFWQRLAFRFGFDPDGKDPSRFNFSQFFSLVWIVYLLFFTITGLVVKDFLLDEASKKTMGFIGECHSGKLPQCDCRYEAEGKTYVCRLNRDKFYLHEGDTVFLEYYPPLPTICRFLESK